MSKGSKVNGQAWFMNCRSLFVAEVDEAKVRC